MSENRFQDKQPYSKRYGLSPLGMCLDKAMRPALKHYGFAESRILTDWPIIIGEYLGQYTNVQRVMFPKQGQSGGTLYIEVYHSGLATELVYLEPVILEKIATYFGYKAIDTIKWVHRPGYTKPVQEVEKPIIPREPSQKGSEVVHEMVESIEDEALRERLEALGRHIFAVERK